MALRPRPAEWILGGYAVLVIGVAVYRRGIYPGLDWVIAAHLLVLLLLACLTVATTVRPLVRSLAPVLALLGLYGALDLLGGSGAILTHDATVRAWEVALVGFEPARVWWSRTPSPAASFLFHTAYLAYFVIVPAPIVVFAGTRRLAALDRTVSAILIAFVACYLCFIFAPVAGPYYEYPRPDPWFVDNLPARLVYGMLSTGSSFGAAFPSSHVAATWAAAGGAWLGNRRLGAVLAAGAVLLTISVVYCQMHYLVDAVAGFVVGAAAIAIALRLHPTEPRNARAG